jgi:hypothetical protein
MMPVPAAAGETSGSRAVLEPFVDAAVAAEFMSMPRRRLLDLVRRGIIPGYPLGQGRRRTWRFRLSDLSNYVLSAGTHPQARDKIRLAVSRDGGRHV